MKTKIIIAITIIAVGLTSWFGYSFYTLKKELKESNDVITFLKTPQSNGFNGFEISVFQALNHLESLKQ